MKYSAIATGLLVSGIAAFAASHDVSAQTAAAWGVLLNGTTGMDNFNQVGNANWRAMEDGIGATVGNGYLVSKESYADFEITAEVWVDTPANSGIFIRCQNPGNIGANTCYEVNIFDTRPGQEYATGAIVNTAQRIGTHMAGGKWNTMVITAKGPQLTITFNGVKSAEATDTKLPRGRFALQYGGGTVKFRKVEIKQI